MNHPLQNKRILLGVTGSIACYKAADLASKLTQAGALVDVVLTESATKLISPLTFQSVTGRKAYVDADLWKTEGHVPHITLGRAADFAIVAPASANTIAKMVQGVADNLLTTTLLAIECPLAIAPAMDGGMLSHPATQANLKTLAERGVTIWEPNEGHLASGLVLKGRMIEALDILGRARHKVAQIDGPLKGKKVVVTAGGTQEKIDVVRYITNRSSGKQGYALAQAALDAGADVILISTPVCIEPPEGAQMVMVESAEQMKNAVLEEAKNSDILLMAAAVADFRPMNIKKEKIKKEHGWNAIKLSETIDILKTVSELKEEDNKLKVVVGFAAESQDLLKNAGKKLVNKKLDMIVANDISADDAGFAVDTNRVIIMHCSGEKEVLPLMSKLEVAQLVVDRAVNILNKNKDK